MQYNGETNGQDICTLAEKLSGTNSKSFRIIEKTLYANMGSRIIWSWIYSVYGYQYSDSNDTDLPTATRTLSAGRQDWPMPGDSAHLLGVSFKDTGGNWNKLVPITLEQIQEQMPEEEFQKTPGLPTYYRPLANGFKIYPASNFTQAASLEIQVSKDVSRFLVGDTVKVPGFDIMYHEAIPTYMSMMKASVDRLPMLKDRRREWSNESDGDYPDGFEQRIKGHYAQKFKQQSPTPIRNRDITHEFV